MYLKFFKDFYKQKLFIIKINKLLVFANYKYTTKNKICLI